MKIFEVNYRDEVHRTVKIEANSKEEAYEKWENGDYDWSEPLENDCQGLSDKDEIMNNMRELE